jgi:hypothetical protein
MICKFKWDFIKELKLIPLFIFIVLIRALKLAVGGLDGNNKALIIQEAEYQAGTIFTESLWNGTQFGLGDIIQFHLARVKLVSYSYSEWLHYSIEYTELWHTPLFVPEGQLQVIWQSVPRNTSSGTPFLTFLANTTKGITTNLLWVNSSVLSSDSTEKWFLVPYSESFIQYSPWRTHQSKTSLIEPLMRPTEPWTPLLNFSSGSNSTSPTVRFKALVRTTMFNSSIKCGFELRYNKTTGLLTHLDFEFEKTWNESGVAWENRVWGDIWLNDVNYTEVYFTQHPSSRTIPIFKPVPFLILSALMVLVFRKDKKNSI